jgi:putative transposase
MSFALIDAKKADVPVQTACAVLGVSASGYYAWKNREASSRQRRDLVLLAHIRSEYATSNETYGSPRMHAELKENGLAVGLHRVARLMSENGMKARQKTRWKKTTDSDHGGPVAINVLAQDFTAKAPDQKWGVDISYVWTAEGWLYLAIVLDLFSRRIVGWSMSDRMKRGLAMDALKRAITVRKPAAGLIHHSDRGSQYCSADYRGLVRAAGFVASMSGRGNCYDNAMVESVFKTIKSELVWRMSFTSRDQARRAIGHYIEGFYNPRRRHSSLGYVSPATFERTCAVETGRENALHW